jgi:heme oxygenase
MRRSSLRDLLRTGTAAAHADLENTPLMRAFALGDPAPDEYRDYLVRQLRLHRGLESSLHNQVPDDWSRLRLSKSAWLEADLRALDAPCDARAAAVPAVQSWAEALGAMYVIEGSTLGLQMVRKRLRPDHPAAQAAGRFVAGYGAESAHHWRAFVAALECLPERDWTVATTAARATFDSFHRVFSEPCR